ncbi:MAG: YitT family protein [Desulfobacteraceae bacterium]|nr:YitT family protein [Desulfobacteraceae bacterium]
MKFNIKAFRDYTAISIGAFLLASGISIFLVEARVIPGGVTGLGVAINYATHGYINIGVAVWLINIPLFIWGFKVLGKQFGIRTFFGFSITSFCIDLLRGQIPGLSFVRPFEHEAIQNMLANDFLLFIIIGAIFVGIGLGVVFKFRGTTGGTDILAAIAQKKLGLKPGYVFMFTDFFIISFGGVIIHLTGISPDKPALTLTLYAFVLLFGAAKLIDVIIEGFDYANSAIIISQKYDEISKEIMNKLSRGATALHGRGLYSDQEREVLYTVITRKEISLLTEIVENIDPHAFIIINNVHEVLGQGFRPRI